MQHKPLSALAIPAPEKKTIYPQPFAALVEGREKRKLGDYFGLTNFGINLTTLAPGAISALYHHHSRQDEFVYILQGTPALILAGEKYLLNPGDCIGFKAGTSRAHQLINQSTERVVYLEIGDRCSGDEVGYPNDDLKATMLSDGQWSLTRKDGRPY